MDHICSREKKVSVAVMARDEEGNVALVLSGIRRAIRRHGIDGCEVFLVDGYSVDDTVRIALRSGVRVLRAREGKGNGVRKALAAASGEYLVLMDADGSHDPNDIPRLLEAIREKRADMVIASRITGGSEEMGPGSVDGLLRLAGNKLSSLAVNARWGTRLTDVQNGYRILKVSSAKELPLQEHGFAIEQEMVMKMLRAGKKISEIPGREKKRLCGRSKISKRKELPKYLRSLVRNI